MLIGFHVSIAGGLTLAVERAQELGCTTMQIFTHSPRAWKLADIGEAEAREFRKARQHSGIAPLFVHASYLINLASKDAFLYGRSIDALRAEMLRAEMLGAEYVVTHMGSASGSPLPDSIIKVADALKLALSGLQAGTMLLLENTAGERGDVGYDLEDIGVIIRASGVEKIGVAFDTCHGYGAGYDIRRKKGLEDALQAMDSAFGLGRLRLVHLNDSKHPLGSRRDRHENIGQGMIGKAGFRLIINHPALRDLPFVMETPKSGMDDDRRNMEAARKLRKD